MKSFHRRVFALHKIFHLLPLSSCRRPVLMLALFLHCAFACAAPVATVVYPASEMADDVRFDDLTEILRAALEKTRYNRTQAAELLGISFRQLRYRMQRLAIHEPD